MACLSLSLCVYFVFVYESSEIERNSIKPEKEYFSVSWKIILTEWIDKKLPLIADTLHSVKYYHCARCVRCAPKILKCEKGRIKIEKKREENETCDNVQTEKVFRRQKQKVVSKKDGVPYRRSIKRSSTNVQSHKWDWEWRVQMREERTKKKILELNAFRKRIT